MAAGTCPTKIGDYEIIRELGKGGMATVYLAKEYGKEDQVALKVFYFVNQADETLRNRFEQEITTLTRLHHPSIVPIKDTGEWEGYLFYAMMFVDGRPLSKLIRGFPRRSPTSCARLVKTLAEALQHAHTQGVIHRDVKSGNVLLVGDDEPFLTDFGLAKLIDKESDLTNPGDVIGTTRYVAPELFNGSQPTTLVDIYGVGTIFYELLTGRQFFEGVIEEAPLVQHIMNVDPIRPRSWRPSLDRDADAICMKLLDKNPKHRYQSAHALVDDLERYLSGRPTHVRPPGFIDWTWKGIKRNKARTGLMFLAAAIVIGLSVGAPIIAWREHQWAAQHNELRSKAVSNFELAAKTLRRLGQSWFERHSQKEEISEDDRKEYELFLEFNERLAKDNATEPGAQLQVGWAHVFIGHLRHHLGIAGAEEALTHGIDILSAHVAERGSNEEVEQALAHAFNNRASAYEQLNRLIEAEKDFRESLRLHAQLALDFPANEVHRREQASTANNLGLLLMKVGRPLEAVDFFVLAVGLQKPLVSDDSFNASVWRELGWIYTNYAHLLEQVGRTDEALVSHRDALRLHESLVRRLPNSPIDRRALATTMVNLGVFVSEYGRWVDAEHNYEAALGLQERLTADYPGVPLYQLELSRTYLNFANLLAVTGRPGKAEQLYVKATARLQQLDKTAFAKPEQQLEMMRIKGQYAVLLHRQGRRDEAEVVFQQALRGANELAAAYDRVPVYRQDLASLSHNYGAFLEDDSRQLQQASQAYVNACDLHAKLAIDFPLNPQHRMNWAQSLNGLAKVRYRHRAPEAEKDFRDSVDILTSLTAEFPSSPDYQCETAMGLIELADFLSATGNADESQRKSNKAQELLRKLVGDYPDVTTYRLNLSVALNNGGLAAKQRADLKEAEKSIREAIALIQKLVDDSPTIPQYRHLLAQDFLNLGTVVDGKGPPEKTEEAYQTAIKLLDVLTTDHSTVTAYQRDLVRALSNLATLVGNSGRSSEAEGLFKRAISVQTVLVTAYPKEPGYRQVLAKTHHDFAGTLMKMWPLSQERLESADREFELAQQIQQRLVADHADEILFQQELGHTYLHRVIAVLGLRGPHEAKASLMRAMTIFKRLVKENPHRPDYTDDVARAHHQHGELIRGTSPVRWSEAERAYRSASEIRESLIAVHPGNATWHSHHGGTLLMLAIAIRQGAAPTERDKRLDEAEHNLRRSIEHQRIAWSADPGNLEVRARLFDAYRERAAVNAELGRHDLVIRMAEDLAHDSQSSNIVGGLFITCCSLAEQFPRGSLAKSQEAIGKYARLAVSQFDESLRRNSNDLEALNNLAWLLATCPDKQLLDIPRAVNLANRATTIDPKTGIYWNTLGIAHYRAGQLEKAFYALKQSTQHRGGGDSYDWFFLAMVNARQGDVFGPMLHYLAAVAWMEKNNPRDPELQRFRAEAEATLGVVVRGVAAAAARQ